MDYEKKYKEALERARKLQENSNGMILKKWLWNIFPELAESEDEKIRKELLNAFQESEDSLYMVLTPHRRESFIAWLEKQGEIGEDLIAKKYLINKGYPIDANGTFPTFEEMYNIIREGLEKQGEHKPTIEMKTPEESLGIDSETYNKIIDECIYGENKPDDNVEPKFKVGDFIVNDYCMGKVIELTGDAYLLDTGQGIPFSCEHNAHLWTIADAKDGDVLASELCDSIILFRGIKDDNIDFYCDYDFSKIDIPGDRFAVNNGQHYGNVEDSKDFHPATKEQHDLLFQKMHEAGYMWASESKQLLSLKAEPSGEQKPAIIDIDKMVDDYANNEEETYRQGLNVAIGKAVLKPAWSEKDEFIYQSIIDDTVQENQLDSKQIDWLKSIKGRMQPKQECSEEDSVRLQRIIDFLWYNRKGDTDTIYQQEQDIDWLKSLKDLNKCSYTFNKIDKEILNAAILFAMNSTDEFACNGVSKEDVIDWLKSLK